MVPLHCSLSTDSLWVTFSHVLFNPFGILQIENLTWISRVMGWAYFCISNGSCLEIDIRERTYKKGLKLKLKMRHILQSLTTSIQCIWLAVFGKLLYYVELKGSNSYIQWTLIVGVQIPVLLLFRCMALDKLLYLSLLPFSSVSIMRILSTFFIGLLWGLILTKHLELEQRITCNIQ